MTVPSAEGRFRNEVKITTPKHTNFNVSHTVFVFPTLTWKLCSLFKMPLRKQGMNLHCRQSPDAPI